MQASRAFVLCTCMLLALSKKFTHAAACDGPLKEDFNHCIPVFDVAALYWRLQGETVRFGVEINQASGWFSMGVSDSGSPMGSDMWIVSKDLESKQWTITDAFLASYVPEKDDQQDVALISAASTGTQTTVVFERKLDTCDSDDITIHPNQFQSFIFARQDDGSIKDLFDASSVNVHPSGGVIYMQLNGSESTAATNNESQSKLELRMPNVTVPQVGTATICYTSRLPSDRKYHITSAEFNVSDDGPLYELSVFGCQTQPSGPVDETYNCTDAPPECAYMDLGWMTEGSKLDQMPPEAGFPMGGGDGYLYATLVAKYSLSPSSESDSTPTAPFQDNSGVTLTYTSDLRLYDLGVLWAGEENFKIPPHSMNYSLTNGLCPSECLANFTSDITLVSAYLYMGGAGSAQTIQHLKRGDNGKMYEIQPVASQQYYMPSNPFNNFQDITPGSEKVARTDALLNTCKYNTEAYDYELQGPGQEYCYGFLRYYPAQKMNRCWTSGPWVNDTALAYCLNQQDFNAYLKAKGLDSNTLTQEDIETLRQAGFLVQYDPSKYKSFTQYDPTCPSSTAVTVSDPSPGIYPATPPRYYAVPFMQEVQADSQSEVTSVTMSTPGGIVPGGITSWRNLRKKAIKNRVLNDKKNARKKARKSERMKRKTQRLAKQKAYMKRMRKMARNNAQG